MILTRFPPPRRNRTAVAVYRTVGSVPKGSSMPDCSNVLRTKKTNGIAAFICHLDDKILIWIPGPKYHKAVPNLTARLDEEGT